MNIRPSLQPVISKSMRSIDDVTVTCPWCPVEMVTRVEIGVVHTNGSSGHQTCIRTRASEAVYHQCPGPGPNEERA